MKPFVFASVLVFALCFSSFDAVAQSFVIQQNHFVAAGPTAPSINWDSKVMDAGKVELGKELTFTYRFVNEGSSPVKIVKVSPSCGCTGTDYSKDAVAPGAEAFVSASYKARHKGHFNKTVRVFLEEGGQPIVLMFKGEAVAAD